MKTYFLLLLLAASICTFAQKEQNISDDHASVRSVEAFNEVLVSGPFTIHYSMGSEYQLAVSASDNAARDRIVTKVVGKQLVISLNGTPWKNWGSKSNYTVYISSPLLHKVIASGAVDFDVHDQIKSTELKLVFSGASDFSGDVFVDKLDAVFSGGSDLKATGKVNQLKLTMSGASDCKCINLIAEDTEIVASGASDVKISVNKSIHAIASGASDIEYTGAAIKVETRSSGASSITKKGS